ncbi:MAG: thiamine phosphate synthase [Luteolibacter sp.]
MSPLLISNESGITLMENPQLYAILDLGYVAEERAVSVTLDLLAGGADLLQLRAKNRDLDTIERVASLLQPLCREAGIPFILNDFPELAAKLDADGVHIGQNDGPLSAAREIIGPGKIIGRSTHSLEQARAALAEGFDYIGFGPLFPTPTKLGRPGIGLENIAEMERDVGSRIPAFCIGGIKQANLPDVLAAGARRIVIVSDLLLAGNVQAATAAVKKTLNAECGVRNAE